MVNRDCKNGNINLPCEKTLTKVEVISQYEQDIEDEKNLGTKNDGNLTEIITAVTSTNIELSDALCRCIHGFDFDKMPTYMLDCYGSILGISRETCGEQKIFDNVAYGKIVKMRVEELSNSRGSMKDLIETLDDVLGGGYKICQDDKCISIFMERDLTALEKQHMQSFLDALPIPLTKCVNLYPKDIKKCFWWDEDGIVNVQKVPWDNGDWDCKDVKPYHRKNPTDKTETLEKCHYWDAPIIANTPYSFHEFDKNGKLKVGYDFDGAWDCGLNTHKPQITDENFEQKALSGTIVTLNPKVSDANEVKRYEWRDENNILLSDDPAYEYTFTTNSHLVQLEIFDKNGLADRKVYHLVGMEAPEITAEKIKYKVEEGKTVTIDGSATDNIKVAKWEWYLDGVLISKEPNQLVYDAVTAGQFSLMLVVTDDDGLSDIKAFDLEVETPVKVTQTIVDYKDEITKDIAIDPLVAYNKPKAELTYSWTINGVEIANTEILNYTLDTLGKTPILLTVTTPTGATASKTFFVDAIQAPKINQTILNYEKKIGEVITVDPLVTDEKPNLTYSWKIDGVEVATTEKLDYTVQANETKTAILIVTDSDGLTATEAFLLKGELLCLTWDDPNALKFWDGSKWCL